MSEAIAEVPTLGPRPDAEGTPIGELDLMRPDLFHDDYHVPVFKRLRDEARFITKTLEHRHMVIVVKQIRSHEVQLTNWGSLCVWSWT